tara:strand:+ start:1263 stop:1499 length:237 start_codon:yes stop_codon:yes gene_type:complete
MEVISMYSNKDLLKDVVALKKATHDLNLASKMIRVQAHIIKLNNSDVSTDAIDYWKRVYSKLRGKQVMNRFKQGSKPV